MHNLYFFDLPVYRLAKDVYNAKRDRDLAAQISWMSHGIPEYEPSTDTKAAINQHQYKRYGPWLFNEIIGYIRLHFLGSQIRGEYFSAEKKRNGLSRHKVFTYRTHKLAAESNIRLTPSITNAEIFTSIKEHIDRCKSELAKGRIIDDNILMTIGPHIDWRGLLVGNKVWANPLQHPLLHPQRL